jgi:RNA polymerase sigma factor (sigma-70 family)
MATNQMNGVVQHLRRGALLADGTALSDGQLLERYLAHADDGAFAALVRRHGPMVWGVCRRALGGHQDAEDAFQAVFLVLVRKAATVEPREMLANWLYGVAYHTALKARAMAIRQKTRERQVREMPEPTAAPANAWQDLELILDQELSRLPDKYRWPVVLCDLEGKSYKEAARQLSCPDGTLAARLARARAMLARRLARHGIALSAASLSVVLTQNAASACVPAAVVSKTIKAASLLAAGKGAAVATISAKAAALTEGMVKTMWLTKLRNVTGLFVTALVMALGAGFLCAALAQDPDKGADQPQAARSGARVNQGPGQPDKKSDAQRFIGTWRFASALIDGQDLPEEFKVLARLTFTKDGKATMTILDEAKDGEGSYKIVDPGKVDIAVMATKEKTPALYKFDGDDKLTLCLSNRDGDTKRPETFHAEKDSGLILLVLERAKPGEEKPTAEEIAKYKGAAEKIRSSAAQAQNANNLKQIGLAMHTYHDVNNRLPAHAIYSKDGKTPLLSWRVAILPFIEEGALYKQFKLDEPWDSDHNKKLIAKMPRLYTPLVEGQGKPGKSEEGKTYYQVFTGPDTVFNGTNGMPFADITDGLSNTILVIEGKEPVIWTKPDDLTLPKEKEKMPAVGGQFKDVLTVLLCDGAVYRLRPDLPAATLRALVTPAGGETVDLDKLQK